MPAPQEPRTAAPAAGPPAPPGAGRIAAAALALAAAPLAVLAALALLHALPLLGTLAAALAVLAVAAIFARLWLADTARLAAALDRLAAGAPAQPAPALHLPPETAVAEALGRAARTAHERTERLAQAARAAETILARLPDPLVVLDEARAVKRLNPAARALFGRPGEGAAPAAAPDAATTAPPADLAALLRQPAVQAAIGRALAESRPQAAGVVLPVPVERHLAVEATRLDPPLPDGGRVLLVVKDVTALARTERMRADFVANASHELRTPLASLVGFIETLRGPAADDAKAQARFLGIMHEQAARMARLIDDLLSLSRIELAEHTRPTERVALAPILRRAAESFEPRLAARGQRLALDLAEQLPPVLGDADQLAQVFHNLIDNAIKYGREGGSVGVSARPAAGSGAARAGVEVTVADDGPGIPRQHLARLTERFYRVDAARSRAAGGTGLGLAIVKHIVNRHRGQLAIASEEGQGTRFAVWLPAAPAEAAEGAGAPG